ncbi:putative ribose/galactose/methyl galactoside import ATP-binding protein 1 [Duganella rhizosphaerae]|uniref:sugar ABC transporter ATP-binding protein n=1 Tax=Duganella rhizosphaerae TaxID=2885763 RepID=UPI0030E7772E
MRAGDTILSVRGVSKRFPGVVALDGVDLDLRAGEVHALCGENGAGKSTLMKILSGVQPADAGQIVYRGQPCNFQSPVQAAAAGIAIIHQELNLIPHLSVAENIFLAREPRKGPFVDRARLRREAGLLLERLRLAIDPRALVKTLSLAQRQMVEIAKALSLDAEVLIMDEPTSALTESETGRLFEIVNELARQGAAIVYISHRLEEFRHIVDRVTILRDGKTVSTALFADTSIDAIVAAMVGRALKDKFPVRTSAPEHTALLTVAGLERRGVFGPVDLSLRRGEILGFAGLMGAGRTEVARAICGADRCDSGEVRLGASVVTARTPAEAIARGLAYLSEDRKQQGLAIRMSVAANLTMANLAGVSNRFGFIDAGAEDAVARQYIAALEIKTPSPGQPARYLSGGNQQKVAIGKWLFRGAKVIFFDEPTRGIDVGAKWAIYALMDRLAAEGVGVVLISSELPEILGMTDRVAVFREGKISGVLTTRESTQEDIMHLASTNTSTNNGIEP